MLRSLRVWEWEVWQGMIMVFTTNLVGVMGCDGGAGGVGL